MSISDSRPGRRFLFQFAAATLVALAAAPGRLPAAPASPPHLVIILADDLGYGSVGCYGADPKLIRTPHIDRLAREGARFLDGNTPSSVCTPTRYGLLTGRYCWRTRLEYEVNGVFDPLLIEPGRPTLARLLQARGYRTAAIGKWHLGYGDRTPLDYTGILSPGPLTVGFDYHFGVPQNNGDRTGIYVENDRVRGLRSSTLTPTGRPTHYGPDYLGLDAPAREEAEVMTELGDRAVRWIADVPVGTPFFAYLTPTAVHEPIWPARATSGTSTAGPFGDFIHDLDRFVGRVLEALEKKGVLDQTLVLFSSDNGGVVLPSGGGRNDAIFRAQQAGLRMNGPWRGRKHSVYEGGFRVPLLARWPGHVPAGSEPTTMVNLVDVFATVAELVGAPHSGAAPGGEDSVSFLPQLLGRTTAPSRQAMVVHSAKGNFAVRDGEWKYIEGRPHPKVPAKALAPMAAEYQPQLYRLRTDPGEQHNVLAQYPAEARRLAALLETQRRQSSSRGVAAAPRP